jgi:hypothetical protein
LTLSDTADLSLHHFAPCGRRELVALGDARSTASHELFGAKRRQAYELEPSDNIVFERHERLSEDRSGRRGDMV